MAVLISIIFIFSIIALGMWNIAKPFVTTKVQAHKTKRDAIEWLKLPKNDDIRALILALRNEGYFGRVKADDADITYINNPVLSDMIERLSVSYDLAWALPEYRLRIRTVTDTTPEWLRGRYTHILMTPTHAVGFNPKTGEDDLVYS